VSLAQIKHCPPDQRTHRQVREIMRPADAAVTIAASASVSDALRQMVWSPVITRHCCTVGVA
jgi:hypothetical protein